MHHRMIRLLTSMTLALVYLMGLAHEASGASSKGQLVSPQVESLDGPWLLATDPKDEGRLGQWFKSPTSNAVVTTVPWIIQDAFPGYHGVAWFWREFRSPPHPHAGGRYLLRFWAVDYKAEVWVNGQAVGSHEGGETPFTLDVTDAIKPNRTNRVAVRVINPTDQAID